MLNIEEIPAHIHDYTRRDISIALIGKNGSNRWVITGNNNPTIQTSVAGGDQAHNNLPPYIVVYFYKRVTAEEFQQYYNLDASFNLIQEEVPDSIIE